MMTFDGQYATIVVLPHGLDGKPIWADARPVMFPREANVFTCITEMEELTKHCMIVLGTKVYHRSGLKSILDLSQGTITYAIHVHEVPKPEEGAEEAPLDVDEKGRPKFRVIQGGKNDAPDAA